MANILILVSIMLLSSYLTEQIKLSHDNMIDKSDIETNTLKEFDARKSWPQCKTIGEVHDEGNTRCGWGYAAAGVLADRMCIATNGSYNQLLSTEDLIFCSGIKGTDDGTVTDFHSVWKYLKSNGLVSGGKYNTNDGCQPSKVPPICNLPTNLSTRACVKHCYGNDTINYNHDEVKVTKYYDIIYEDIQKEVQTHGPVSVWFDVYNDFFLYKSGVYAKNVDSTRVRAHYAKLIGWGVENGVDYWLLVNSWGYDWGQNGLFKIKRGTNECHIEDFVYAGLPKTK